MLRPLFIDMAKISAPKRGAVYVTDRIGAPECVLPLFAPPILWRSVAQRLVFGVHDNPFL